FDPIIRSDRNVECLFGIAVEVPHQQAEGTVGVLEPTLFPPLGRLRNRELYARLGWGTRIAWPKCSKSVRKDHAPELLSPRAASAVALYLIQGATDDRGTDTIAIPPDSPRSPGARLECTK